MMNETAKELGSSEVTPTHLLLGILKSKKGIAYNILKNMNLLPDKDSTGTTTFCSTGENLELVRNMAESIIKSNTTTENHKTYYQNLQI